MNLAHQILFETVGIIYSLCFCLYELMITISEHMTEIPNVNYCIKYSKFYGAKFQNFLLKQRGFDQDLRIYKT